LIPEKPKQWDALNADAVASVHCRIPAFASLRRSCNDPDITAATEPV
jgi:hypothetical protein